MKLLTVYFWWSWWFKEEICNVKVKTALILWITRTIRIGRFLQVCIFTKHRQLIGLKCKFNDAKWKTNRNFGGNVCSINSVISELLFRKLLVSLFFYFMEKLYGIYEKFVTKFRIRKFILQVVGVNLQLWNVENSLVLFS